MKKTVCGLAVLTILASTSVLAHQQGDILVRAGIASVVPNDSSDKILGSQSELSVNSNTQHLPPTVMVQYYFGEAGSTWRPYVGAGLNYTNFFDEKFNDTGKTAGLSDLKLDDSWGLAANVGVDYMLDDNWFFNASVWYANIETTAKYKAGVDAQSTDVKINPWVFMISGGYKF